MFKLTSDSCSKVMENVYRLKITIFIGQKKTEKKKLYRFSFYYDAKDIVSYWHISYEVHDADKARETRDRQIQCALIFILSTRTKHTKKNESKFSIISYIFSFLMLGLCALRFNIILTQIRNTFSFCISICFLCQLFTGCIMSLVRY